MVASLNVVFNVHGRATWKETFGELSGSLALLNNRLNVLMITRRLLIGALIWMALGGINADKTHAFAMTPYLEHNRVSVRH
jgi:hypothetical protein